MGRGHELVSLAGGGEESRGWPRRRREIFGGEQGKGRRFLEEVRIATGCREEERNRRSVAARRRAAGKKGRRDGRKTASFDEKFPTEGRWQAVGDAGEGEWWLAKRREERGREREGREGWREGGGDVDAGGVGRKGETLWAMQGKAMVAGDGREERGREGRGGDIDAGGGEGGRDAVGDAGKGDGGWRRREKREGGRGRPGEGRYLGGRVGMLSA